MRHGFTGTLLFFNMRIVCSENAIREFKEAPLSPSVRANKRMLLAHMVFLLEGFLPICISIVVGLLVITYVGTNEQTLNENYIFKVAR